MKNTTMLLNSLACGLPATQTKLRAMLRGEVRRRKTRAAALLHTQRILADRGPLAKRAGNARVR